MAEFICEGNYKLPKLKMKTDKTLHKNLKSPLSSIVSGSMVVISGAAGSGKSSALINIFTHKKCPSTGKKMNLKGCFDNIFIVSPSMDSFSHNVFESLEEQFKYEDLLDFLDNFKNLIKPKDGEQTAIILDDVGSQIRNREVKNAFNHMVHNRRHQNLTLFVIVQNLTMIPPAVRDSMNVLIAFKPKTITEQEYIFQLTGLSKKWFDQFFKKTYQERYDCCWVDMSLSRSNDFELYRNIYNRLKLINA